MSDLAAPRRRLPARFATIVMPLVLSIIMTCIISAVSTFRALGLNLDALRLWPSSWLFSWMVAFPVLLVVLPVVRRIVALLVHPHHH